MDTLDKKSADCTLASVPEFTVKLQNNLKESSIVGQWIETSIAELNEKYNTNFKNNHIPAQKTKNSKKTVEDTTYVIRKVKYTPQEFTKNQSDALPDVLAKPMAHSNIPVCHAALKINNGLGNYAKIQYPSSDKYKMVDLSSVKDLENSETLGNLETLAKKTAKIFIPSRNYGENAPVSQSHNAFIDRSAETLILNPKKSLLYYFDKTQIPPTKAKIEIPPKKYSNKTEKSVKLFPDEFEKDFLSWVGNSLSEPKEDCLDTRDLEKYGIIAEINGVPVRSIKLHKEEWTKSEYYSIKKIELVYRSALTPPYYEQGLRTLVVQFNV
jgi:hypothetical protein